MDLENRLAETESPYLREAANQPVRWQIYSDEAFKLAMELDRPILLDIGAVWCHWCHVMDNECYSDSSVAEIINKHFVPIKVDRDQMPDVDSRYQVAVGAVTGAGGWPLTGFLTPDGKVFYGGTYFPKNDIEGRQGLLTLLPMIAEVYAKRRTDVVRAAEEISRSLKEYDLHVNLRGELSEDIVREIVKDAQEKFDRSFGGFGSAPKFFNPTALHLLAEGLLKNNETELKGYLKLTLDCIARGGVYDQVGGGFHRYSVDRYWHVPHFEKMLYDNALMLRTYLLGIQLFGEELYFKVARETADWIIGSMKSADGPFYAHQDADVGKSDDGTYWTWTKREVEEVLAEEEREIVEAYFDVRETPGDIREFPERNVLRVALEPGVIAGEFNVPEEQVTKMIVNSKMKLLESRGNRKTPFIDETILVDRNGLAISALVEASLVLKERKYFRAAEGAADFILEKLVDNHGKLFHAFSGKSTLYEGLLDDYVYFGVGLIDLFDVGRNDIYLDAAERIAEAILNIFADKEDGGFYDRGPGKNSEGLLAIAKKPIEDSPMPSGNSSAAIFLDRLFVMTDNRKYFEAADRTLKAFAGSAPKMGIYSANFGRAVNLHLGLLKTVR